jgi:tRNA dimethylallyltransferase
MASRIWLIAGPTASGKSALAVRLAEAVGGEVIGADALQVYRDLPVLTAIPDLAERRGVPHHLVGVADAADGWSVGRWLGEAQAVLARLRDAGRDAIIAGGTGLYFTALTDGLAEIPPVPADVRARATESFDTEGELSFRSRLAQVDPAAAERILPGDRQRLVRALEVFLATGKALSGWQAETRGGLAPGDWRSVRLMPPRPALYARCDARFDAMAASGALEEVRDLVARGLDTALPAMKAVGLRPLAAHLAGDLSLDAALDAGRRETRNYVKRQEVWLRGRMANWPTVTDLDAEAQWRSFLALNPDLTP